jgi:hypothetical protein
LVYRVLPRVLGGVYYRVVMGEEMTKQLEKSNYIIEKNGKRELRIGKPPILDEFFAVRGGLDQYFWNMTAVNPYRMKIFIHFLENYSKTGSEYIGIDALRCLSGGRDRQVKLYITELKKHGFIKVIDGIEEFKSVYLMSREFNDSKFRKDITEYLKKALNDEK